MEHKRHSTLFAAFILVSLLLHLLGLYILSERDIFQATPPKEPMVVEIRPPEPPPSPEPRERELDLPKESVPERPREEPARRLGPVDSVVEKEIAPEGDFPEDRQPAAPPPATVQEKPTPPAPPPVKTPKTPKPRIAKPRDAPAPPPADVEKSPERAAEPQLPAEKPVQKAPEPLPDMRTLIASANKAVENLADRKMEEWRQKYREDVETGGTTWLDMEKDILISFFQRFRNNIYGVWGYPRSSVERREEGTSLLKITINRDGSVKGVQLMESSGYDALDHEAIEAVKKGASYGPLPRAYQEETLSIFAFFRYNLSTSHIRGGYLY